MHDSKSKMHAKKSKMHVKKSEMHVIKVKCIHKKGKFTHSQICVLIKKEQIIKRPKGGK